MNPMTAPCPAPAAAIEMAQVAFRWPGQAGFAFQLEQLSIANGEKLLLLGDSGSGKSTLLSLICGIVTPQSGKICVAGKDITKLRTSAKDRFRADHIGLIFQQFNLLPWASVHDNITLPLRFAPMRRARAQADPKTHSAAQLCARLGLPQDSLYRPAGRLSVGQQQRVAVARALIGYPPLIVADEPTSALDATTQSAFLQLLFEHCNEARTTLMMVSHDARLAEQFDRVVHMSHITARPCAPASTPPAPC